MDFTNILEVISQKWSRDGLLVAPSDVVNDMESVLRGMGGIDTESLIAYFAHVGGMRPDVWDEELLSFWSWNQVSERLRDAPVGFVPLCDWSLDAHLYGVAMRQSGEVGVFELYSVPPERVADSFHQFLEIYVLDPSKIIAFSG